MRFSSHAEASKCIEANPRSTEESDVFAGWSQSERILQGAKGVYGLELLKRLEKELKEELKSEVHGGEAKQLHVVVECSLEELEAKKKELCGLMMKIFQEETKAKEAKAKEAKEAAKEKEAPKAAPKAFSPPKAPKAPPGNWGAVGAVGSAWAAPATPAAMSEEELKAEASRIRAEAKQLEEATQYRAALTKASFKSFCTEGIALLHMVPPAGGLGPSIRLCKTTSHPFSLYISIYFLTFVNESCVKVIG